MLALVEHQRQHRAQILLVGVVAAVGFPDAAAVAQQAQRHPAVRPGLMFEQQVEPLPRRRGRAAHLEQQVGDGAEPLLVDEGAWGAAQGGPEDAALVRFGQACAEEGRGLLGIGEHQAEQVIVGLMQGRCHFSAPYNWAWCACRRRRARGGGRARPPAGARITGVPSPPLPYDGAASAMLVLTTARAALMVDAATAARSAVPLATLRLKMR